MSTIDPAVFDANRDTIGQIADDLANGNLSTAISALTNDDADTCVAIIVALSVASLLHPINDRQLVQLLVLLELKHRDLTRDDDA